MKENYKICIGTILISILTAVFIVIYVKLINLFTKIIFLGHTIDKISSLPFWYLIIVPTISIFIVNFIISIDSSVREYGVVKIARMIKENRMSLTFKNVILKIVASVISIGSGYNIGNEGPSSEIGAMVAYQINKLLKLSFEKLEVLISIGAASGIAAVFVSPLTGVAFALENIAYKFFKEYGGNILLGGMISFLIAVKFLTPITFEYHTLKNINFDYIFALIIFIPLMIIFIYIFLFLNTKFLEILRKIKHSKYKIFIISLIGGISIGVLLKFFPYAVFSGHVLFEKLVNNNLNFPITIIFLLIILRIFSFSVSYFVNAVGGLFLPLMSIGALIGYGFGTVLTYFNIFIEPFYFAAIGAAIFVGVNMNIPFTAAILALEITYDYNIIIPVGISVVIIKRLMSLKFNIKMNWFLKNKKKYE